MSFKHEKFFNFFVYLFIIVFFVFFYFPLLIGWFANIVINGRVILPCDGLSSCSSLDGFHRSFFFGFVVSVVFHSWVGGLLIVDYIKNNW